MEGRDRQKVIYRPTGGLFINLTEIIKITDENEKGDENNQPIRTNEVRTPGKDELVDGDCQIIEVAKKAIPLVELSDETHEETVDSREKKSVMQSDTVLEVESSQVPIFLQDSEGTVNLQDSEGTVSLQDSEGTVSLRDSEGVTNLEDNGGIVSLQEIEGIVNLQDSEGTDSLKGNEGTVNFQDNGETVNLQDSEGTVSLQDSEGTVSLQDRGGTANLEDNGGTVSLQENEGIVNLQDSEGTDSLKGNEGTVNFQDNGETVNLQDSEGTVSLQNSEGTVSLQDSGGAANLEDNGGTVSLQESEGIANLQGNGRTVNSQDSEGTVNSKGNGRAVNVQGNEGMVNFQGNEGTVNFQDIEGPVNLQDNGGTASLDGNGGAANLKDNGGAVNLQDGAMLKNNAESIVSETCQEKPREDSIAFETTRSILVGESDCKLEKSEIERSHLPPELTKLSVSPHMIENEAGKPDSTEKHDFTIVHENISPTGSAVTKEKNFDVSEECGQEKNGDAYRNESVLENSRGVTPPTEARELKNAEKSSALIENLYTHEDVSTDENKLIHKDVSTENIKRHRLLQKLAGIFFHENHDTQTDHRRVICRDCKTRICPVCFYNFSGHLKVHMSSGKKIVFCEECGASFSSRCALKAHLNLHKVDAPFVCPDCGCIYQQLRFFLAHCLDNCFHLFIKSEFNCEKCHKKFYSLDNFRKHQRSHIVHQFRCSICCKDLGVSRQMAARHVRIKHPNRFSQASPAIMVVVCEYCEKVVPPDHIMIHKPRPSKTMLACPCGVHFNSAVGFRNHRVNCHLSQKPPKYWADIFQGNKVVEPRSASTELLNVSFFECKMCGDTFERSSENTNSVCSICSQTQTPIAPIQLSVCKACGLVFRRGSDKSAHCLACTNKICSRCGEISESKNVDGKCPACLGITTVLSEWLGGQQVVGAEDDKHEPCDIEYPGQPIEHSYCVRHAFLIEVKKEISIQKENFGFAFLKSVTVGPEESDEVPHVDLEILEEHLVVPSLKASPSPFKNTLDDKSLVKCCICEWHLPSNRTSIYELLSHMKKLHKNAVLPVQIPKSIFFKKSSELSEDEDVDLLTRLKKLEERKSEGIEKRKPAGDNNQVLKKQCKQEPQVEETPSPRKRMRLYIPKDSENHAKKYLPQVPLKKKEDIKLEKGIVCEKITGEEAPPRKEHEIWDNFYERLSAVEHRNQMKVNKEVDLDFMPSYCNKRRVKKPRRFLEEENEDSQSSSKKGKSDSESPTKPPEKKISQKVKDVPKKDTKSPSSPKKGKSSCESLTKPQEKKISLKVKDVLKKDTKDGGVFPKKNRKQASSDVDEDLEDVKKKLKKDEEIDFIEKTFDREAVNQSPNKRKRKLASKLVYLKKLNKPEVALQEVVVEIQDLTCIICKAAFSEKLDFRSHLMTHRTDENTFQCMECGECFVVRPTLEKHLHAFHKIKDTAQYIEENQCNMKLGIVAESENQNGHLDDLAPNQCKVCRELFPCALDLAKHFRIHGMAFLKETQKDIKLN